MSMTEEQVLNLIQMECSAIAQDPEAFGFVPKAQVDILRAQRDAFQGALTALACWDEAECETVPVEVVMARRIALDAKGEVAP